jgi:uncharacterized membrane protein
MNTFSIGECISFGWKTFQKRPWLLILVPIVVLAASFVVGIATGLIAAATKPAVGAVIHFIASLVVNILAAVGTIALYLKVHDAPESAELKDLWHPELFLNYLLTSILVGIGIILGFILLIVPGIILSLVFGFALYLVIDRKLGPIEAMKESARLTRGNRWNLFTLIIAILLINLVGLLALVVGLFVSVPISALAMVHAYRTLQKNTLPPAPVVA